MKSANIDKEGKGRCKSLIHKMWIKRLFVVNPSLNLLNTVYPVDFEKESFQPNVARLIDSSNYNFSTNLLDMTKQLRTDNKTKCFILQTVSCSFQTRF